MQTVPQQKATPSGPHHRPDHRPGIAVVVALVDHQGRSPFTDKRSPSKAPTTRARRPIRTSRCTATRTPRAKRPRSRRWWTRPGPADAASAEARRPPPASRRRLPHAAAGDAVDRDAGRRHRRRSGDDKFIYYLQAGAFRELADAEKRARQAGPAGLRGQRSATADRHRRAAPRAPRPVQPGRSDEQGAQPNCPKAASMSPSCATSEIIYLARRSYATDRPPAAPPILSLRPDSRAWHRRRSEARRRIQRAAFPQPVGPARRSKSSNSSPTTCPHCYAFDPALTAWVKKQGDNIVFKRVHIQDPRELPSIKMYYALDALGKNQYCTRRCSTPCTSSSNAHRPATSVFDFVTRNGHRPREIHRDLPLVLGIQSKLRRAGSAMMRFVQVNRCRSIVVDGRFITSPVARGKSRPRPAGHDRSAATAAVVQVMDNWSRSWPRESKKIRATRRSKRQAARSWLVAEPPCSVYSSRARPAASAPRWRASMRRSGAALGLLGRRGRAAHALAAPAGSFGAPSHLHCRRDATMRRWLPPPLISSRARRRHRHRQRRRLGTARSRIPRRPVAVCGDLRHQPHRHVGHVRAVHRRHENGDDRPLPPRRHRQRGRHARHERRRRVLLRRSRPSHTYANRCASSCARRYPGRDHRARATSTPR
jgi:thiol:disulfide interchange protein DsbA